MKLCAKYAFIFSGSQPLLRSELNGQDFHYVVTYKSRSIPDAFEQRINISDWQQSELIIENQKTFQEYEIYIQSANKEGLAPVNQPIKTIGYSGQDSRCSQDFQQKSPFL